MKNEMFIILIPKIECVVAVSGLLNMGSSRHYLVKMWEVLLRNMEFIEEFDVFDTYDPLPIKLFL